MDGVQKDEEERLLVLRCEFFIVKKEDGEEISTRIIKLKIKKLIEEEDSHNPITDDHVVKILAKDGIKLSRRTVAKYRDQMQIPGSRERRAVV